MHGVTALFRDEQQHWQRWLCGTLLGLVAGLLLALMLMPNSTPSPSPSPSPAKAVPATGSSLNAPAEPKPAETLELFGYKWTRRGETTASHLLFVRAAWDYRCNDPSKRLLFTEHDFAGGPSAIISMQVSLDGVKWVDHGPHRRWDHAHEYPGDTCWDSNAVMGETDGVEHVWRKGKLFARRTYVLGQEHGLSEGWYENGNRTYVSVYDRGKEVPGSGRSWNEDGTPN